MKLFIKLSVFTLLTTATASSFAYFFWYKPTYSKHNISKGFTDKNIERNDASFLRLKQKAIAMNDFAKENNYNSTRCFLVDMRLASGLKRFFVYNFQKDSIEVAGLVTHGTGSHKSSEGLTFSNVPNSNATSVGRYRVGKSYYGKFGLAYKLYGLNKTNSKAFVRFVVLHAHACVPNDEIFPLPICESWGCPTVSPAFLTLLQSYINAAKKPVMLWIYY